MAGGVDTNNRKPRQTRGTPSYYYRNRFALGVIIAGCAWFGALAFTPAYQQFNNKIYTFLNYVSEEEVARKDLFTLIAPKRGETILKEMEEKKQKLADR